MRISARNQGRHRIRQRDKRPYTPPTVSPLRHLWQQSASRQASAQTVHHRYMLEALEPRMLLSADLGVMSADDFLNGGADPSLINDFAFAFEAGFDRMFETLEEVEGDLDLDVVLDIELPALLDRDEDGSLAGGDDNGDGNYLNDHHAVELAGLMDYVGQITEAGYEFVDDTADIDLAALDLYDFDGSGDLELLDVIRSGIASLFDNLHLIGPNVSDLVSHLDGHSIGIGEFNLGLTAGNLNVDAQDDVNVDGEGTYELTFDLGFNLSRSDDFSFDLGRSADLLGLIYSSDTNGTGGMPGVTVDTHFSFETSAGLTFTLDQDEHQVGIDDDDNPIYETHLVVDAGSNDFYLGSGTQVVAGVDTATTLGGFDLQIGFLEISSESGSTFDLTAEAIASLGDPDDDGKISYSELGSAGYVTGNLTTDTAGSLNVLLDIDVQLMGVSSFDDAFTALNPVIQLSGDPFDSVLQSTGGGDPRTAPIVSLLNFDALTPFRNMTDEGFLNILRELESYFTSLENSLDLFGIDLPFVDGTSLLDTLDFSNAITALIDDLYDSVEKTVNGTTGVVDVPTFVSVQELASDLDGLLAGSLADLLPSYSADTLVLSFDFAFAQQVLVDEGFNFNFDLGQVGDVTASGGFSGQADLGVDFTLGLDLSDPAEVAVASTQALFALYSNYTSSGNAVSATVNNDLKLRLKVAGRDPIDVDLTAADTSDNITLDDLADDIQAAVDAVYAEGDIHVSVDPDTGRLIITVDSYTVQIEGQDVQVVPTPLTIELLEGDSVEFAKLGFNDGQTATTSPLPLNGILSADAEFDLTIDGVTHTITVLQSDTDDNSTVLHLLTDLEAAINTAFGAGSVNVQPLNVVQNVSTPDDQGFRIQATSGSSIRVDGINVIAAKELGLVNGSSASLVSVGADSDVLDSSGVSDTGQLSGDANFTIETTNAGGVTTATAVAITAANTADNASLYDLIQDINAALPASVVAGIENGRLVFSAVDADQTYSIRITGVGDSSVAQTELGLDEDMAASRREESLAFISNATFDAAIELDASGSGSLHAGFLGLNFGTIEGGLSAAIEGGFETTALAGVGDITEIESLLGSLGDMDAVANVTVSGDIDLSFTDLGIDGGGGVLDDLQGYLSGLAAPSIDILVGDITGFGDGITLESQLDGVAVGTDYADPDLIVNMVGLEELKHFGDFEFADVLDVFVQAKGFLEQLVDIDFLGEQLPLVGLNLADVLDFVGGMIDIIDDMISSDAATVQELVGTLNDALEQVTDGLINMTYEVNSPGILGFDIDFSRAASVFLPVNIALADLLGAGFEDFANLAGSANIGASFAADLGLSFGVDVSSVSSGIPLIYVFPDETGISLSGAGSASGVSFLASIGPLGAAIEGGSLDLELDMGLNLPGWDLSGYDGKLDLTALNVGDLLSDISSGLAGVFDLDFDFGAVLPVYAQLGGSSQFLGNLDFLAALNDPLGDLQFTIGNLPNFDLVDFGDIGLLDTIQVFVEGFDLVLGTIGDLFSGELFGLSGIDDIPFLGDVLDAADDFIEDIRSAVVQPLLDLIDGSPEFLADVFVQLQELIFNAFDALGALPGAISDAGDIAVQFLDEAGDVFETWTDVDEWPSAQDAWDDLNSWISAAHGFEFALDLGGDYEFGFGDVDLGLPVLGLEIEEELTAAFAWSLFLGMGVNLDDGFYFKLAPNDGEEIGLDLSVSLPSEVEARLGFLTATATNLNDAEYGVDYQDFFARFSADLDDANGDGKLTFSEIPNANLDVGFGARVDLNLQLELGFSEDIDIGLGTLGSLFPSVGTSIDLDWGFGSQDIFEDIADFATVLPENASVIIDDIFLNVGSFLSDVLAPVVDIIQTIVGPFDPLLDILTSPIPVISDLAGQDISLLDIAAQFGYLNQGLVDALTFISDLYDSVSGLNLNDGGLIVDIGAILGIGPIIFGGDGAGAVDLTDANTANLFQDPGESFDVILSGLADGGLSALGGLLGSASNITGDVLSAAGTSGGAFGGMNNNGLIFPFLEDPTQLIGLLFGRDMTLISFDLAPLEFGFEYSQFFSIWGPIGVTIGGGINALIDFAFGYDTYGIRTFADNNFTNPLDLMAGFYIYDDSPALPGVDVPEIVITGQLTAALAINIGIAEAGVGGGIFATAEANLNDPNDDFKVRPAEIWSYLYDEVAGEFTWENVICIFDYSVLIEAKLFVYVEALWGLWEKSWEFGPSLPLLDLEYSCEPEPLLATDMGDGTLRLNMGEYASERIHSHTDDVAEDFSVYLDGNNVMVSATIDGNTWVQNYGNKSKYDHILGHAGEGNDTIDLSEMDAGSYQTSDLTGGTGGDTLIGGAGQDVIYGDSGIDVLRGGDNSDFIDGGSGDDRIDGGLGNDILHGRLDDDIILGGGDDDVITGDQGNDVISAGSGNDRVWGGDGIDWIAGGAGNDTLVGDLGDDWIWGDFDFDIDANFILTMNGMVPGLINGTNTGNDWISGGGGSDWISGDKGDDLIWGDSVFATEADGQTVITESDPEFGFTRPSLALSAFNTSGHDVISGGAGNDRIWGEDGNDVIRGDLDDDITNLDDRFDMGSGSATGDDWLYGGRGADTLFGNTGDDHLYGGSAGDFLFGNAGNDVISGAAGRDAIFGDDGEVSIFTAGDAILPGGVYNATTFDPKRLATTHAATASGDDEIDGGIDDDFIFGGSGADTITGDGGEDLIFGDNGEALFEYHSAIGVSLFTALHTLDHEYGDRDEIEGYLGADIIIGGRGGDVINGDADGELQSDDIIAGDHADLIRVLDVDNLRAVLATMETTDLNMTYAGDDLINGGGGDDIVFAGPGSDQVTGGDGQDVIVGDNGALSFVEDADIDTLDFVRSADFSLIGDDWISGGAEADIVIGGGGEDHLYGDDLFTLNEGGEPTGFTSIEDEDAGADILIGDQGEVLLTAGLIREVRSTDTSNTDGDNDVIHGNQHNDVIIGGVNGNPQPDQLFGDAGDDIIIGDEGEVIYSSDYIDPLNPQRVLVRSTHFELGHDDHIYGNAGDDLILGGTGADRIRGDNLDDAVEADPGHDILFGDQGRVDYLNGLVDMITATDDQASDGGDDDIQGNDGRDVIVGGVGSDRLLGEGEYLSDVSGLGLYDDVILGDLGVVYYNGPTMDDTYPLTIDEVRTIRFDLGGDDTIIAGAGSDVAFGGSGNDTLIGDNLDTFADPDTPNGDYATLQTDNGDDILVGDQGFATWGHQERVEIASADTVEADGGVDYLQGNAGSDVLIGGTFGDRLVGEAETLALAGVAAGYDDVMLGDEGRVLYTLNDADVAVFDRIETDANGASGDANLVLGGNDILLGGAGNDIGFGGSGNDTMIGDNLDTFTGMIPDEAYAVLQTDPGRDRLIGDQGVVEYDTGILAQVFTTDLDDAQGGVDYIEGNDGDDTLMGGVHGDTLMGESWSVTLVQGGAASYNDVILGDEGRIEYDAADGDYNTLDLITTHAPALGGADTIFANRGTDYVFGGADNDEIHGDIYANNGSWQASDAGAQDWLLGDNGQFSFYNGLPLVLTSTDTAIGGDDHIHGDDGDDMIIGGVGADTLYGETQLDSLGLVTAGNDAVLGDNGRVDWALSSDTVAGRDELGSFDLDGDTSDQTTLDRIMTIAPTDGGNDVIFGNGGDDLLIGGTGADRMWGDSGDGVVLSGDFGGGEGPDGSDGKDLMFGDHAKVYPSIALSNADFVNNDFFAIDTAEADAGGDDAMFGNGNDDIMLGQQGDDVLFGGTGDDDLIGGHNVVGGIDEQDTLTSADYDVQQGQNLAAWNPSDDDDLNDILDAGSGNDVVAGDNAVIIRQTGDSAISPRFRMVGDSGLMYTLNQVDVGSAIGAEMWVDESFSANVTAESQANPDHTAGRDIRILDHSAAIEAAAAADPQTSHVFGNDVIAGGADDDELFGQLGDDIMQGDGYVELDTTLGGYVSAFDADPSYALGALTSRTDLTTTALGFRLVENALTDGDDYLEGNGGNDRMYGGLGQDDMIGGSSSLFGLAGAAELRPDGADLMYGASGQPDRLARNADAGGHRLDADVMLGDNGNIYRLVDAEGYLSFNYDTYANEGDPAIRPRAVDLLDYGYDVGYDTDTGSFTLTLNDGVGKGDLMFGEAGDDILRGMHGDDVLFGNAGNDDLYGEHGNDWLAGGTGIDGILGDDGLLYTSRNTEQANNNDVGLAESLYGIAKLAETDLEISTPGNLQRAIINVDGELKRTADLIAFRTTSDASDQQFNDIIFGGLGSDWIHSGDGDDAVSGAEALPFYYSAQGTDFTTVNTLLQTQQEGPDATVSNAQDNPFWFAFAPYNPGDILRFEGNGKPDEFALYDEYLPREQIWIDTTTGERVALADLDGDEAQFLLNFNANEGAVETVFPDPDNQVELHNDGADRIFGDLGNDWIVGGTGRDHMYGGRGSDLINMDDDHATNSGANDAPDAYQAYADIVYGGSGRDVMILNTGADRSIDWVGEFNSYIVPFSPFGAFHISRSLQPHLQDYLYDLSESDGADQTLPDGGLYVEHKDADVRTDDPDPLRNYEPFGELGMVLQSDYDWNDQTGAPSDPQPGNLQGPREIMRRELFAGEFDKPGGGNQSNNTTLAFSALSGSWALNSGSYDVAPDTQGQEAVSLYYLDETQPDYMEILATLNMDKDRAGWKSNGYIIFDYQDEFNFKFAGLDAGTDKIQIGHRTEYGWAVDTQSNLQLRDGRDYNLTLALHGTVATLYVNGGHALSFSFGDPLNDGYLGLGTDGAKANFDDWQIQKLPPVVTLELTDGFDDASNPLNMALDGWSINAGLLTGVTDSLVTTHVDVQSFARLELEALLSGSGSGGLVFDYYGDHQYKFVTLDMASGELQIGHVTDKGTVIDSTVTVKLKGNGDHLLSMSMLGGGISVLVDGTAVAGHVYNSLVNDGDVGLLVSDGSIGFDSLTIRTDDPAYLAGAENLIAEGGPADNPVGADQMLTEEQLALMIDAGKLRWAEMLGDESQMSALDIDDFIITDLPGQTLGMTLPDGRILIDATAAGYGWFLDATPLDDAEFGNQDGAEGMDLLSVVMHEMGHAAGIEGHAGDSDDLMSATLSEGERQAETTVVDSNADTGPDDGTLFEYVLEVAGEASQSDAAAVAGGLVDWSGMHERAGGNRAPVGEQKGSRVSAFPEFLFELNQLEGIAGGSNPLSNRGGH